MNRSKALWYVAAAVVASVVLLIYRVFIVGAVAAGVFALLLYLDRPKGPSGEVRHLVMTPGLAVAGSLSLLALAAQLQGGHANVGVFVAAAVAAAAVVDLLVGVVATRKARATVVVAPTDLTVGESCQATLEVSGLRLPVTVQAGPSPVLAVEPATKGALTVVPGGRGVLTALQLEVRSTGLCGLAGFLRRWMVPLPTAVCTGPRPLAPDQPFPEPAGRWGEGRHLPAATGDAVRGVRDYVRGDPRSQVHWRTTARTGRLVVKELEEPVRPRLLLVLDLGFGGEAGEQAAARAAWYLEEARRRGVEVVLENRDAGGIRRAPVTTRIDAIRRLAWATPGPLPASAPAAAGDRVLRVRPEGDVWD